MGRRKSQVFEIIRRLAVSWVTDDQPVEEIREKPPGA